MQRNSPGRESLSEPGFVAVDNPSSVHVRRQSLPASLLPRQRIPRVLRIRQLRRPFPPPPPPPPPPAVLQDQDHLSLSQPNPRRYQPPPVRHPVEVRREPFPAPPSVRAAERRAVYGRLSVLAPSFQPQEPRMDQTYEPHLTHRPSPALNVQPRHNHYPLHPSGQQTFNQPNPDFGDFTPPSEPPNGSNGPFWQLSSSLEPKIPLPPVKVSRQCLCCMETLDEDLFPHKCTKCSYLFCHDCLKSWFLDACRNESKMPPKCCSAIPVSSIEHLLTKDQMELFKAKYEEWSTPDRLYCPVNTCSAFISPRLYIKPSVTGKVKDDHVSCPGCGTSVCTRCHSSTHLGACPESNLDPELEVQLRKWKIKRCPKCRTGVRKVFGCSHVECRCGAHFCWECLLPIAQCDGRCEDSEDDAAESEPAEDDLDGLAGFNEDEYDFGPEPYGPTVDVWGCHHIWTPSKEELESQSECQICYRHIRTLVSLPPGEDHDGDTFMEEASTWQCAGAHASCPTCPKMLVTAGQPSTSTYAYSCPCGFGYCPSCNRSEKMKDLETAYECRCGMRVCGACKDHMQG